MIVLGQAKRWGAFKLATDMADTLQRKGRWLMGKTKRAFAVGEKAAELGYRLQREHPFWGNFWLWASAGDFPVVVTPDLDVIESFLHESQEVRNQIEEVQREEWRRRLMTGIEAAPMNRRQEAPTNLAGGWRI